MSKIKRRLYFIILLIIFVVATPLVILYAMGYRFDSTDFIVSKRGAVFVYVTIPDTDIYIDNKLEDTTGLFNREYISDSLEPGRYFVRAEHEEFQSWEKYVEVNPQQVVSVYPFLVPSEFEYEIIPERIPADQNATSSPLVLNTEYERYVGLFEEGNATSAEVTQSTPDQNEEVLRRIFGNIEVWYEDKEQTFYADWLGRGDFLPAYFCENGVCESPFAFLQVNTPATHFDFYPGRDDVIIFSSEDGGVYAVELDKRPPQKFVTIYKGTSETVDFRLTGRDTLVINDEEEIITTILER